MCNAKFDMNQCKNGDRLRTRGDKERVYIGKSNHPSCTHRHAVEWGDTIETYRDDGTYLIEGTYNEKSCHDIIGFAPPIPKIVKCEAWVNLYMNGLASTHKTKTEADEYALAINHIKRLECRKIEWQYEDNN